MEVIIPYNYNYFVIVLQMTVYNGDIYKSLK